MPKCLDCNETFKHPGILSSHQKDTGHSSWTSLPGENQGEFVKEPEKTSEESPPDRKEFDQLIITVNTLQEKQDALLSDFDGLSRTVENLNQRLTDLQTNKPS